MYLLVGWYESFVLWLPPNMHHGLYHENICVQAFAKLREAMPSLQVGLCSLAVQGCGTVKLKWELSLNGYNTGPRVLGQITIRVSA